MGFPPASPRARTPNPLPSKAQPRKRVPCRITSSKAQPTTPNDFRPANQPTRTVFQAAPQGVQSHCGPAGVPSRCPQQLPGQSPFAAFTSSGEGRARLCLLRKYRRQIRCVAVGIAAGVRLVPPSRVCLLAVAACSPIAEAIWARLARGPEPRRRRRLILFHQYLFGGCAGFAGLVSDRNAGILHGIEEISTEIILPQLLDRIQCWLDHLREAAGSQHVQEVAPARCASDEGLGVHSR